MNSLINNVSKYNFWDNKPEKIGILRQVYLDSLDSFREATSFVVVTGARRAGKSYLMRQYISMLIDSGVKPRNILYLNFFIRAIRQFTSEVEFFQLLDQWRNELEKSEEKKYLILDEVQEIENWDHVVASLVEDYTFDAKIIITGSNSQLLEADATNKLSGRYVTLQVFPFSFLEFFISQSEKQKIETCFLEYIKLPSTPEACLIKNEELRANLIEGIINTTVQKDVVERYNPNNPAILSRLVEFIRLNSSNQFSIKSTASAINNSRRGTDKTSEATIETYLQYLTNVYFCHICPTFSSRKKGVLERSNDKIYLNDVGMALFSYNFEFGRILENIIFLELLRKNFKVCTFMAYKKSNLEVDFWAKKANKCFFIQVAWMLGDPNENEKVYEREFGNLMSVRETGEKYVISMDAPPTPEKFFPIKTITPVDFIKML